MNTANTAYILPTHSHRRAIHRPTFPNSYYRYPHIMSTPQTALIIGATGQTGRHLLNSLLQSPHYSRVSEYGRHVTPKDNITTGLNKLDQKVVDFENLADAKLSEGKWDVVFITLGTTRATAGSAKAFEKIDRDYVINSAKEAKNPDPAAKQRLVYLSSAGANSSSYFLYPRSKGLTEDELAKLGYADTIIFRPGFLADTNRKDSRMAEGIALKVTGLLSHFSSSIQIPVSKLGKAMCKAGYLGTVGLPQAVNATQQGSANSSFTVVDNAGALKLSEVDE